MQVNVAGLRRNIKNLAHNYSDAQVKVREATSNDPWGPSATIMAEIADLTYNVVAFSEIMQMVWKRLNDHGKNWRHVYKALILLEYLIKTGTEKVSQQCKENIYAIQTLREFVYFEEGKDQGTHVREKAKQLVILLKDDERLKNERAKALKAKERFAQHPSGFGSDGFIDGPLPRDLPPGWQEEPLKPVSDLELVRPQTAGEEELQLQLAMAMSREEAEQEEAKRRSDDVRLQLALSQSEQDFNDENRCTDSKEEPQSHLLDLLDISLGATSISSPPLGAVPDPWGIPVRADSQLSDPWTGAASPPIGSWNSSLNTRNAMGVNLTNSGNNNLGVNTNVIGEIGAVGGIGTHMPESWTGARTHSPSITSGSSNEGWLNSNGIQQQQTVDTSAQVLGIIRKTDPWEMKAMTTVPVTATTQNSTDPKANDTNNIKSISATLCTGLEKSVTLSDPWAPKVQSPNSDPWKKSSNENTKKPSPDLEEFDVISNRNKNGTIDPNQSNNNASLLLDDLDPLSAINSTALTPAPSTSAIANAGIVKKPLKDPQAFLGENSALVNLDNLIKPAVSYAPQMGSNNAVAYNPFSDGSIAAPKANLFQQPPVPSINQLKKQQPFAITMNQDPWAPVSNTNTQKNCFDFNALNNNDIEYMQNGARQNYKMHSINASSPFSPSQCQYHNNENIKTAYLKNGYHDFPSHSQYIDVTSSDLTFNKSTYIDRSENYNERCAQSVNNIQNMSLLHNDNDYYNRKNSQNSQFSCSPLYPKLSAFYKDDNLEESLLFSSLSTSSALSPQFTNNNNNITINHYNYEQSLDSANVPPSPILSTDNSITAIAKTTATSITFGASSKAETTFQSRSDACICPNPFAFNYYNELQASLATTPGVIIKPILTNDITEQMNFNEFSHDFTSNNNANNINNAISRTTTNKCILDNNNSNYYNKPWLKSDTSTTASNPFLS